MKKLSSIQSQSHSQKSSAQVFAQNNKPSFFKPVIQPKFTINNPLDQYEKEADAVADKVMRMRDHEVEEQTFFKPAISFLQRKCDHCREEEKNLQRKEGSTEEGISPATESYINSLSGGKSLNKRELSFFESRMGYDFSNVRVHTDRAASESSKSLNAHAYTHGNNILLREELYQPESNSGKRLLAHELAHVVQQHTARPSTSIQRQLYPPVPIILRPLCRRRRLNGSATPNTGIVVTWSGSQIAIHARIQFSGPGANAQIADAMKRDIERVWNASFTDGYASTCQIDVLVGGPEDATRAQIIVGTSGNVSQSYTMGRRMYFMYSGSPGDLVWSPSHEFAHFLGLDDRRTRPWWDVLDTQPETSEQGYEHNIMGAIPGGDYNRRGELVLESRNIRDWLNQYATEYTVCADPNTA